MSERHRSRSATRGALSLLSRLAFLFSLIFAGFVVVGYAAGWVSFEHDERQQKATIEIETGEFKEAAQEVVHTSRDWIHRAGEKMESLTQDDTDPKKSGLQDGTTSESL